jgi:hypothetical protein
MRRKRLVMNGHCKLLILYLTQSELITFYLNGRVHRPPSAQDPT